MPPKDELFLAEEQQLPTFISPTTDSPGYIVDFDLEEDTEEDPTDYPADERDDDDDNDESSDNDENDDNDDDVEEDEDEEEEENPDPADSVPPLVYRVTAKMSIRAQTPISLPSDIEILSPPLPVSSPPLPASLTYPLGYRAAMIRLRAETPSTSHPLPSSTPPSGTPPLLPIPLPTPSPPFLLPSTSCRAGVSKVTLPPQKRLCIALGLRYEVGKSSSAPTAKPTGGFRADYGFDEIVEDMQGTPAATNVAELSQRMTDFVMTVRQDIDEIYGRLDDAQDDSESTTDYSASTADGDCRVAGSRPHLTGAACGDTDTDEDTADTENGTKKTTRSTLAAKATTTTTVTNAQLKAMIDQGVIDALAARDADRNTNGDDSQNSGTGVRKTEQVARECTYPDFMKCQPLNFKDTEGVVELIQWFEKMETVFSISNYSVENQIKFSTCTLLADLKKKMTDKYYPRGEIKKLEAKLWNLKVKGTDMIGYNQHFQELALLCIRMFPEESDKIERYVSGLPDMIYRSVVASRPKIMQELIEIATELMDKKICTFAKQHSENKRKQDDNQQQQQNKRQNTGRAYVAWSGEKKPYGGSKPFPWTFQEVLSKAKKQQRGNQGGNGNALAKVYAVGHAGTNLDSNVVMGTFLLNNRYASVLFVIGADKSFVSTAFSSQIDITPSTLDH
ncbi:hypothetical protein Tco_0151975 [Tanacetum coccineum]